MDRKKHYKKASNGKSSSKFSKSEQNSKYVQEGIAEAIQNEKFRYGVSIMIRWKLIFVFICRYNTKSGRRNSNVTVKSNNEKFTETEITWSENTDRLI